MKKKIILLSIALLFSLGSYAEEDEWESFFDGTKTIHIKFKDTINDKYIVDVLWTPDDGLWRRLNGPAVVNLSPVKSNNKAQSFVIEYDYFHLPERILLQLGILNNDSEYNKDIDLNKTYFINYDSLKKGLLTNNTHSKLGETPFFFDDVNYDGIQEFVIVETGSGQRYTDRYYFYKLDKDKRLYKRFNLINSNKLNISSNYNIDSLTKFNKIDKTIKVWKQGGYCSGMQIIYKQRPDLEFHPIAYTKWNSYANGVGYVCVASEYNTNNGKFYLKSKSESYWDSDKGESVELDTKYFKKDLT